MNDQYIISALKAGFGVSQIAAGLGVTPSAVSQRIDENGLKDLAVQNSKFKEIDEAYNDIESTVLKKLQKSMQYSVLTPMQACQLLRTVNGAKRRSLSEGQQIVNQNNVQLVQLNLPERHMPKVTLSDKKEVLEVNGRLLQTLPSGQLEDLRTQQIKEKKHAQLPKPKQNLSEIL